MIPLRDTIPTRKAPVVNWAIIVLNILVFLYQYFVLSRAGEQVYSEFILTYGLVPGLYGDPEVLSQVGLNPLFYFPFISSMFLHGDWLHLIFNMLTLYIFGDNVEDKMGRFNYLLFYILCGLAATTTHVFLNLNSEVPVIGASGAISGIMAAYLFLFPKSRILILLPIIIIPFFFHLPAWIYLGIWFIMQWVNGIKDLGIAGDNGGVAFFAHIGGFIAGIILYRLFIKRSFTQADPQKYFRKYPNHIPKDYDNWYYRGKWK